MAYPTSKDALWDVSEKAGMNGTGPQESRPHKSKQHTKRHKLLMAAVTLLLGSIMVRHIHDLI